MSKLVLYMVARRVRIFHQLGQKLSQATWPSHCYWYSIIMDSYHSGTTNHNETQHAKLKNAFQLVKFWQANSCHRTIPLDRLPRVPLGFIKYWRIICLEFLWKHAQEMKYQNPKFHLIGHELYDVPPLLDEEAAYDDGEVAHDDEEPCER